MKRISISILFLLFAACGKNDAVRPVAAPYPNGPINQAPMPPGGAYPPPAGYPTGGGYPPPYFQPHMPPMMPPQYTPFLPIDNYFRRTPQLTQIYVNIWVDWRNYAQYNGYHEYDFNGFWFDYCRNNWQGGYYGNLYQQFDQNVYWWTQPGMSYCDSGCDANYFWQNYSGYSYTDLDTYYCDDCNYY